MPVLQIMHKPASVHLSPVILFAVLAANLYAADFAGDGFWQLVNKFDYTRVFVSCNLVFDKVKNIKLEFLTWFKAFV